MDERTPRSREDVAAEISGTGFRHDGERLTAEFRTADFASAVRLLDAVAIEADAANHHPDVRLGWGRIEFDLVSHDVESVTNRDVELAKRIAVIAHEHGATTA
ncbi:MULTISPECIES: 4a-hydroxytetrahydrobiopterin dehydratase [unclassified Agromyces]|uniref:4a-hydroxytetrahydrobiopterin dehydratase n=1 Tax=unclassified Agromyces TaxID=2639701 RepID=UPI0007B1C34D|nr:MULTISPECIES: 4a-hydroxytetrahydrobiopterin dehydratase [unclassified Agromyces]KZE94503.1 putative pterin-4-alpha-carbinolamine dehydratase [Agromyces sp. NDB4Y10]MCK8610418.1 4a-hydroxytetrahydrobiopterin dehydratase [Agromyces sp. C10]